MSATAITAAGRFRRQAPERVALPLAGRDTLGNFSDLDPNVFPDFRHDEVARLEALEAEWEGLVPGQYRAPT